MPRQALIGARAPDVTLAQLVGENIDMEPLQALTAGRNAVFIGVPGAFTPICSYEHVPQFIEQAERLRGAGFGLVACVAPNDPWTVSAWAREIDPRRRIAFYSDGNLALARALHATVADYDNYLGETSTRYLMVIKSGVIMRLVIEPHPMELTCTRADDVLIDDEPACAIGART